MPIPNGTPSESSWRDVSTADPFGTGTVPLAVEISTIETRPRGVCDTRIQHRVRYYCTAQKHSRHMRLYSRVMHKKNISALLLTAVLPYHGVHHSVQYAVYTCAGEPAPAHTTVAVAVAVALFHVTATAVETCCSRRLVYRVDFVEFHPTHDSRFKQQVPPPKWESSPKRVKLTL